MWCGSLVWITTWETWRQQIQLPSTSHRCTNKGRWLCFRYYEFRSEHRHGQRSRLIGQSGTCLNLLFRGECYYKTGPSRHAFITYCVRSVSFATTTTAYRGERPVVQAPRSWVRIVGFSLPESRVRAGSVRTSYSKGSRKARSPVLFRRNR